MASLLENYKDPKEIKKMSLLELEQFSKEIREFLIDTVSVTGGHLASNLGVVELTISLYNVFNFPKDRLVFDVGHQAYVHKILTGRKAQFSTLRKFGGISGFPKCEESVFDMFETGHSSTSISAAIGMARARDLKGEKHDVVAVIGDGALTGGMALEALNDVGYRKSKMIIILNDNQMSISKNVGGLSTYLSKIRMDPKYNKLKQEFDTALKRIPNIGKGVVNSIEKIKDGIKQIIVPGMFFEDMGIKYLGPIDGHNIKEVSKVLSLAKNIEDPVLVHVVTKKGKGYNFAEKNPNKFHGVGPFNCDNGEICFNSGNTYSGAFSQEMLLIGEQHKNAVAITAAMPDGTGLNAFAQKYSNRFFDVGIAEQHAVTLAAGMAKEGLKPIFAVYSTFLQRAYDQVLHDVCIQKLPVIFAIDRAGVVGEDGETHQGVFDLSYLTHMPNMTIMTPKCVEELKEMLRWAVGQNYPISIRYPRGGDYAGIQCSAMHSFTRGKWELLCKKGKIAIIAAGKMVQHAILARERLEKLGVEVTLINACFVKPIDIELIRELSVEGYSFLTVEDNMLHGGMGSLILEYINAEKLSTKVINLGYKDEFIPHGGVDLLYKLNGIDPASIVDNVLKMI